MIDVLSPPPELISLSDIWDRCATSFFVSSLVSADK
jgi:hypothetical protein